MVKRRFSWFSKEENAATDTTTSNSSPEAVRNKCSGKNEKSSTVSIKSVREIFTTQLSNESIDESNLHPKDIVKVQFCDKFIQRYIDQCVGNKSGTVTDQEVIVDILKVLKWRKEFGINDFVANDFPIEYLESGLFREARLPNGDILFCLIARKYQRIEEWRDIILKAALWYYEQLETKLDKDTKIIVLFDAQKCGMQLADFSLLFNLLPILLNYYSSLVHKAYWYQMPWFLTAPFSIALSLLPSSLRDRAIMITDGDIFDTLGGTDNVPDFLGGSLETYTPPAPQGLSNVQDVGEANGMRRDSIEKFKKSIEKMHSIV